MVDAINYCGSLGWGFVQAYTIRKAHHWLLKINNAKLSDEEQKWLYGGLELFKKED